MKGSIFFVGVSKVFEESGIFHLQQKLNLSVDLVPPYWS